MYLALMLALLVKKENYLLYFTVYPSSLEIQRVICRFVYTLVSVAKLLKKTCFFNMYENELNTACVCHSFRADELNTACVCHSFRADDNEWMAYVLNDRVMK